MNLPVINCLFLNGKICTNKLVGVKDGKRPDLVRPSNGYCQKCTLQEPIQLKVPEKRGCGCGKRSKEKK